MSDQCHSFSQRRREKLSSQRDTQVLLEPWFPKPDPQSTHIITSCSMVMLSSTRTTCSWRSFLNSSRIPASPRGGLLTGAPIKETLKGQRGMNERAYGVSPSPGSMHLIPPSAQRWVGNERRREGEVMSHPGCGTVPFAPHATGTRRHSRVTKVSLPVLVHWPLTAHRALWWLLSFQSYEVAPSIAGGSTLPASVLSGHILAFLKDVRWFQASTEETTFTMAGES